MDWLIRIIDTATRKAHRVRVWIAGGRTGLVMKDCSMNGRLVWGEQVVCALDVRCRKFRKKTYRLDGRIITREKRNERKNLWEVLQVCCLKPWSLRSGVRKSRRKEFYRNVEGRKWASECVDGKWSVESGAWKVEGDWWSGCTLLAIEWMCSLGHPWLLTCFSLDSWPG